MNEVKPRVLVVDDEKSIRRYLQMTLGAHGYKVFEAATGEEALAAVVEHRPDVVILDQGLPDIQGVDVTRELREWTQIPIVFLSVQEGISDKIAALDAGADDYLTKPFDADELRARLRAVLRRMAQSEEGEPVFKTDDFEVDLANRVVTVNGEEVRLTPTEYDLLRILINHVGKVLTHDQLLRLVWGPEQDKEIHILRVHVSNLRQKLEPDPARPKYILTEPGIGYRLRVES